MQQLAMSVRERFWNIHPAKAASVCLAVIAILIPCHDSYSENTDWDIVIVGGGIAGLSAAYTVKDYRVLLLEKEDRLGGRIKTLKYGDIHYDVGAPFISNIWRIPFTLSPKEEVIYLDGPMGIY